MIRTQRRIRLCATLLACNLAFIWGNSMLPGELSGQLSDWVKGLLALLFEQDPNASSGGGLLRKLAHFTEFACLGMLLHWLFAMLDKRPVLAFLLGTAAACVDETIQRFVPDRGPSVKDVLIDASGVLTGMLLLYLGHTIRKRRSAKNHLEE